MTQLRADNKMESAEYIRTAASGALGADYDIIANDPAKSVPAGRAGRPCRTIYIGTAGTLVVTGVDGTNVTVPTGILRIDGQFKALVASGSSAQGIVVAW